MKIFFLLFFLSKSLFAQTYGNPQPNSGPDHGAAENFSAFEWQGSEMIRSELNVNGHTYSYIRNSLDKFKLSLKEETGKFTDVIPNLTSIYCDSMDEYSRLLHVYEDEKLVNIYCWGVTGYNFFFYQKRENQEPRLIRFGSIQNKIHSMVGFDKTIQSIEFIGAAQMTITKVPTAAGTMRDSCEFNSPGVYEFRPDGVYLDGVFDPSVADREPQDVAEENFQKDPQFFQKKQALHADRVASYTKEVMEAEAARIAAMPPQPTLKPSVNPKPPEPKPEPTVAPSPHPKTPAATTEPERTLNFTPWLAGLVALLVMLLGYLAVRYIRRRA